MGRRRWSGRCWPPAARRTRSAGCCSASAWRRPSRTSPSATPATGWWSGPGPLPGAAHLAGLNNGLGIAWIACAGFVLLLTPTGRLPSPRWRWWARVAAAAALLWLLGSIVDPAPLRPEYPEVGNPLAVPALFGPLDGLVAVALVVALAALVVGQDFDLLDLALGVCAGVLPLATGAAILRYRLYDLDRIISRTVAYGLLTLLLGAGYAAVVLGLGRLLPQGSSLVVAAATLAVAAVFLPARRRVQRLVDRRFNRRRHDAGRSSRPSGPGCATRPGRSDR